MGRISYWRGKEQGGRSPVIEREYLGRIYASKKEANYAAELELLKRAGEIEWWVSQYKVELQGKGGKKVCDYYVDFKVKYTDGRVEYVEVKGWATELWKLKKKLFEQQLAVDEPEAKFRIID